MLIVYAHPSKEGHCGEILQQLEDRLKKIKLDYELLDLYDFSFDPVFSKEELVGEGSLKSVVKDLQKKILKHDDLVFIYPTWWASCPAILKGFFDRVFLAGFAYKYVDSRPKGLLKGKKAMILNTAGGPTFYQKLIGLPSVKIIKKRILEFCAVKVDYAFLGSARHLDDDSKKTISKMIDKTFKFFKI